MCFIQGDRGYEGPKGSRGPPGLGYKGDKVWIVVKSAWFTETHALQTSHAIKDDVSDYLSYI